MALGHRAHVHVHVLWSRAWVVCNRWRSVAPRVVRGDEANLEATCGPGAQRGAQVGVIAHAWLKCAARVAVCSATCGFKRWLGLGVSGRYQPRVGE